MSKILTVSIAAYNMERYIRQALDSLIDERIIDDLEVFVIDDGGTDSTLEIAKEYAAKYPNSILPIHKENGGYGTTINYSIAHSTGIYFKFLDGDDWFSKDGLFDLVNALKHTDADVLLNTSYLIGPDKYTMKCRKIPGGSNGKVVDISNFDPPKCFTGPHITYRTEILRKSKVELPPHMFYTDNYYLTIPFAFLHSIQYLDWPAYCYRQDRKGQSTSPVSFAQHLEEFIYVHVQLCIFYENQKKLHNEIPVYLRHRISSLYRFEIKSFEYKGISKATLEQLKECEKRIYRASPDIYYDAERHGRLGIMMKLFRKTHYAAFWLMKLMPMYYSLRRLFDKNY